MAVQAMLYYQAGQQERFRIERKDGKPKEYHRQWRCRYAGWLCCTLQP